MLKYNVYNKRTGMNKSIYFLLILCLPFALDSNGKEKQHTRKQASAAKLFQDEEEKNPLSDFKFYTIGKNTSEGIITFQDSIIKVVASGTDIGSTNDEGFFIFKQIRGDFEFSTRINALSPSDLYAKAGIMARQDLTDDSKDVYFFVFPDNQERLNNNGGFEFQYRNNRGNESQSIFPREEVAEEQFKVNFPETWIKLRRDGNIFTSFVSHDNKNWQFYSKHEQRMAKSLLVGFAVTSHNPNGFTKAEFSDIFVKTK